LPEKLVRLGVKFPEKMNAKERERLLEQFGPFGIRKMPIIYFCGRLSPIYEQVKAVGGRN